MLGLAISINGQQPMTFGLKDGRFLFTLIGWRRGPSGDEIQVETCGTNQAETVDWEPIPLKLGDNVQVKLMELSGTEDIPEPIQRTQLNDLPLLDRSP